MAKVISAALAVYALSTRGYASPVSNDPLASDDVCSGSADASCALNELQAAARFGSKEGLIAPQEDCTPESEETCPCAILEIEKKNPCR